jgi:hypothetical protein
VPYEAEAMVEEKRDGTHLCRQSNRAPGLALWSNLDGVSEGGISRATKVYGQLAWLGSK